MVPVSQLQFARKYPFSSTAKNVVRQLVPDLKEVDSKHFEAALDWIQLMGSSSPTQRRTFVEQHFKQRDLSYAEFLSRDIVVFPLVKIILSYVRSPMLYERFASWVADLTFEYLVNEKDRVSIFLELASELKVKVDILPEKEGTFFLIPLYHYLSFPLRDGQLHLVNQSLDHGIVRLDANAACRWLAEGIHASILASLPVSVKGLPPAFAAAATVAQERLQKVRVQETHSLSNGIIVSAFPPCMDKLYSEISSGVSIPHMARFDLATFLINIHMSHEDVVSVFSKASNYDERVTRYHLENLSGKSSGKKYSMPACAKIREHGYCISRTCNVTHPLQYYRRESENPSEKKESNADGTESKSSE